MVNLNGQIDDLNQDDVFDENEPGLEPVKVFVDEFGDDDKKKDDTKKVVKPVDNPFEPKGDDFNEPLERNKIVEDLLKQKGIGDSTKVLYENDKGEVEEVDFYSLPYEDQINILSNTEEDNSGLTEDDLYYIQQARENNISLTELIKYYQDQSIEEYNKSQQASYAVADYSDEELYVLDMKAKLGDSITDEEILTQLEKELEIPEIFKKKVDKLREEYIQLEENERLLANDKLKQEKDTSFKQLGDQISALVDIVEDVGGVTLEDTDKNDILKFMLERDVNGITEYQKQMNDPENMFLAAWAILKAEDTFDVLKGHYEELLKDSKKPQPVKTDKGTQTTVVRSKPAAQKHMSIEDLHKFD